MAAKGRAGKRAASSPTVGEALAMAAARAGHAAPAAAAGEPQPVVLRLPYPPTVNTYWRHVGSRVLVSRRGREYRQEVERLVVLASRRTLDASRRLAVEVDLHPPDARRRDIDNTLKAVLDALKHGGLYEDDSQVDELRVLRRERLPGGCCVVRVSVVPAAGAENSSTGGMR